ncbi:MAG TPA: hypothetical protein VHE35_26230 [Kofleriaceae bacterium]|nr:hypothetical protein [Kofleriaceae bacterium]
MGLAERRAAKDFQDHVFPGLKQQIDEVAGFPVDLEVHWNELAVDDYGEHYPAYWRKVYFDPTIAALTSIARDDLGKDALKAGLKRIVLRNSSGSYSPEGAISFTGGVVTIDHTPTSNVDDVDARAEQLTKILEKAL